MKIKSSTAVLQEVLKEVIQAARKCTCWKPGSTQRKKKSTRIVNMLVTLRVFFFLLFLIFLKHNQQFKAKIVIKYHVVYRVEVECMTIIPQRPGGG